MRKLRAEVNVRAGQAFPIVYWTLPLMSEGKNSKLGLSWQDHSGILGKAADDVARSKCALGHFAVLPDVTCTVHLSNGFSTSDLSRFIKLIRSFCYLKNTPLEPAYTRSQVALQYRQLYKFLWIKVLIKKNSKVLQASELVLYDLLRIQRTVFSMTLHQWITAANQCLLDKSNICQLWSF